MKRTLYATLMLVLTTGAQAAVSGDLAEGKRLHDATCMGCHDSGVYSRKDRQVRSLDDLKQQLESCSHMANRKFSPAEAQNVLKYLNDRFYRFP